MSKISAEHLSRTACLYIRQSTSDQVHNNLESQRRQYDLVDRARGLLSPGNVEASPVLPALS